MSPSTQTKEYELAILKVFEMSYIYIFNISAGYIELKLQWSMPDFNILLKSPYLDFLPADSGTPWNSYRYWNQTWVWGQLHFPKEETWLWEIICPFPSLTVTWRQIIPSAFQRFWSCGMINVFEELTPTLAHWRSSTSHLSLTPLSVIASWFYVPVSKEDLIDLPHITSSRDALTLEPPNWNEACFIINETG